MALADTLRSAFSGGLARFQLRDAEAQIAKRTPEQAALVVKLHRAARRRLEIASVVEPEQIAGALPLYREAAALLIAARIKAAGADDEAPLDAPGAWAKLDALEGLRPPPARLDEARAVLSSTDPLLAEDKTKDELVALRGAIGAAIDWLGQGLEARSLSQVRLQRGLRFFAVGLVVLLGLYWAASAVFAPKNLARGKRVVASSVRPGTPAPANLVNGTIEPTYGVHTEVGRDPWVMIDLGAVTSIKTVKVYNRGDGWQQEMVPMNLEVSDDAAAWSLVDRRAQLFTRDAPWVVQTKRTARYVRLSLDRDGYIALSEVEIY